MYGAIIGDLAGAIYEYQQTKEIKNINIDELIPSNSFFSDDTILTIAILDAILNECKYLEYLKEYIVKYSNYKPEFYPYFKTSFSPSIIKWSRNETNGTSIGNGAMMRISPVGYMFNTEQEVIKNAFSATTPTHNTSEALFYATKIALMIYYFRVGYSKEEVIKKLNLKIEYVPFTKFNTTCKETFGNVIYAIFNSNSFEDAIKQIIFMGGDTDTNTAIVGSVAEAIYGVPHDLIETVNKKIPNEFVKILTNSNYK